MSREVAQEHYSLFKGLAGWPWLFSSTDPPMLAGRGVAGCVLMGHFLAAEVWLAFK